MMMDCRQVKQLLPLWVGQDLPDAASVLDVTKHLEQCSECEDRRIGLQASLEVLQTASSATLSAEPATRTLWPQLVSRISDWERAHHRERFNGWIPASVMSLAVALMIAVSLPSIRDEFFGGSADTNVVDLFEAIPKFRSDAEKDASRPDPLRRPAYRTTVNFKADHMIRKSDQSEQW